MVCRTIKVLSPIRTSWPHEDPVHGKLFGRILLAMTKPPQTGGTSTWMGIQCQRKWGGHHPWRNVIEHSVVINTMAWRIGQSFVYFCSNVHGNHLSGSNSLHIGWRFGQSMKMIMWVIYIFLGKVTLLIQKNKISKSVRLLKQFSTCQTLIFSGDYSSLIFWFLLVE